MTDKCTRWIKVCRCLEGDTMALSQYFIDRTPALFRNEIHHNLALEDLEDIYVVHIGTYPGWYTVWYVSFRCSWIQVNAEV